MRCIDTMHSSEAPAALTTQAGRGAPQLALQDASLRAPHSPKEQPTHCPSGKGDGRDRHRGHKSRGGTTVLEGQVVFS